MLFAVFGSGHIVWQAYPTRIPSTMPIRMMVVSFDRMAAPVLIDTETGSLAETTAPSSGKIAAAADWRFFNELKRQLRASQHFSQSRRALCDDVAALVLRDAWPAAMLLRMRAEEAPRQPTASIRSAHPALILRNSPKASVSKEEGGGTMRFT